MSCAEQICIETLTLFGVTSITGVGCLSFLCHTTIRQHIKDHVIGYFDPYSLSFIISVLIV